MERAVSSEERLPSVRPELIQIRRGLIDRVTRLRRVVTRATGWPLAVRFGVYVCALAAEAFACPVQLIGGVFAVVLLLAAGLPAIWPRSPMVSVFWLLTAIFWLAATTLYPGVATLPRLVVVTAALYLVHTGAALAAVMPYDAVVAPLVVIRWLLRAALILAIGIGLAVAGLFQSVRLGTHTYVAATVVGLALTVGLAWLLASATARRR
jgi:hypothetical protein